MGHINCRYKTRRGSFPPDQICSIPKNTHNSKPPYISEALPCYVDIQNTQLYEHYAEGSSMWNSVPKVASTFLRAFHNREHLQPCLRSGQSTTQGTMAGSWIFDREESLTQVNGDAVLHNNRAPHVQPRSYGWPAQSNKTSISPTRTMRQGHPPPSPPPYTNQDLQLGSPDRSGQGVKSHTSAGEAIVDGRSDKADLLKGVGGNPTLVVPYKHPNDPDRASSPRVPRRGAAEEGRSNKPLSPAKDEEPTSSNPGEFHAHETPPGKNGLSRLERSLEKERPQPDTATDQDGQGKLRAHGGPGEQDLSASWDFVNDPAGGMKEEDMEGWVNVSTA